MTEFAQQTAEAFQNITNQAMKAGGNIVDVITAHVSCLGAMLAAGSAQERAHVAKLVTDTIVSYQAPKGKRK